MLYKRKASLELSIRAIVIVVLAMTLLGLGLGFVRNMFQDISETTGQVTEQIKQQILEDLRRGDKKLSFSTDQVTIGFNDETIISIGVKNTGAQDLNFDIRIDEIDPTNLPDISSNTDPDATAYEGAFFWDTSEQILTPGDANVFGIKYFAPTAKGTFLFKIRIWDIGNNVEYASKSFFVRVI